MTAAGRATDLFGPISSLDVRSLAGPVVDTDIPPGTELAHEGAVIGTFSVIRSGSAHLLRGGREVGTLAAGDCFGEIDPLGHEPQRYTVIAGAGLRLMTFSSFGIDRLCDALPNARRRIEDALPHAGAEIHALRRAPAVDGVSHAPALDAAAV